MKRNIIILTSFIILLIALISVIYVIDEKQLTYLVKIDDIPFEQADFEKFLVLMQYEEEKELKESGEEGATVDMDALKKEAYNIYVEQNVYYLAAVSKGVNITDEIREYVGEFYESETTDKERLSELGITKEDYIRIYGKSSAVQEFIRNISDYYKVPEATLNEYLELPEVKKLSKMMDIRVMQFNINSEEEKEATKQKAQSILERAKAGEDFETLASDNADTRLVQTNDGYSLRNGQVETIAQIFLGELFETEEVQKAVLELKEGEFSEVLEQGNAYIFVKVEKITDGLNEDAIKKASDLLSASFASQVIQSSSTIIENRPLLKRLGLK